MSVYNNNKVVYLFDSIHLRVYFPPTGAQSKGPSRHLLQYRQCLRVPETGSNQVLHRGERQREVPVDARKALQECDSWSQLPGMLKRREGDVLRRLKPSLELSIKREGWRERDLARHVELILFWSMNGWCRLKQGIYGKFSCVTFRVDAETSLATHLFDLQIGQFLKRTKLKEER